MKAASNRLLPDAFWVAPSHAEALVATFVIVCALAGIAHADGVTFPKYDITKSCRAQADYAFAATLGQTDIKREIAACSDRERENMGLAQTFWQRASQIDAAECLTLAEERYGRLARCLETSRSLRPVR